MKRHTKKSMTFKQWFRMLNSMAKEHYGFDVKESSWQKFYDHGYSPREALDEDTYAGV